MNLRSLGHLFVAFFTKPIRLPDLGFLRPGKRERSGSSAKTALVDFAATKMFDHGEHTGAVDVWGRSLGADVSEQPVHTLPAELQEELGLGSPAKAQAVATPAPKAP